MTKSKQEPQSTRFEKTVAATFFLLGLLWGNLIATSQDTPDLKSRVTEEAKDYLAQKEGLQTKDIRITKIALSKNESLPCHTPLELVTEWTIAHSTNKKTVKQFQITACASPSKKTVFYRPTS